jgi:hypothetical protein
MAQVAVGRLGQRLLDAVIARDVDRVDPVRRGQPELGRHALGPVVLIGVSESGQHLGGCLDRGLALRRPRWHEQGLPITSSPSRQTIEECVTT